MDVLQPPAPPKAPHPRGTRPREVVRSRRRRRKSREAPGKRRAETSRVLRGKHRNPSSSSEVGFEAIPREQETEAMALRRRMKSTKERWSMEFFIPCSNSMEHLIFFRDNANRESCAQMPRFSVGFLEDHRAKPCQLNQIWSLVHHFSRAPVWPA